MVSLDCFHQFVTRPFLFNGRRFVELAGLIILYRQKFAHVGPGQLYILTYTLGVILMVLNTPDQGRPIGVEFIGGQAGGDPAALTELRTRTS